MDTDFSKITFRPFPCLTYAQRNRFYYSRGNESTLGKKMREYVDLVNHTDHIYELSVARQLQYYRHLHEHKPSSYLHIVPGQQGIKHKTVAHGTGTHIEVTISPQDLQEMFLHAVSIENVINVAVRLFSELQNDVAAIFNVTYEDYSVTHSPNDGLP